MLVHTLAVGEPATNCYLVADEASRETLAIDPGSDAEEILAQAEELGLAVKLVVLTHAHFDHIGAVSEVLAATGAKLALHALDIPLLRTGGVGFWAASPIAIPRADMLLEENDVLPVGSLGLKVLHTPGHTPGGISLLGEGAVFSGDTLFRDGWGRTDLPGGDWRTLLASIQGKLFTLPEDMVVYPGHGLATTIGREKRFFARQRLL